MQIELTEAAIAAIIAMAEESMRIEWVKLDAGLTGWDSRYREAQWLASAVREARDSALCYEPLVPDHAADIPMARK